VGGAGPTGPTGCRIPRGPVARGWSAAVLDLLFVALTLAVFGVLALIVRALERL